MSRSFRKTPIFGFTTAQSEKEDKRIWHSRFRSREKQRLQQSALSDPESHLTTVELDVSNVWSFNKDGRQYFPVKRHAGIAMSSAKFRALHADTKAQQALAKRFLKRTMAK